MLKNLLRAVKFTVRFTVDNRPNRRAVVVFGRKRDFDIACLVIYISKMRNYHVSNYISL